MMSGTYKSRVFLCAILMLTMLTLICTPLLAVEQSRGGKVLTPKIDKVIIGVKDFTLLAFSGEQLVFNFPIAVGADTSPTPLGKFTVTSRLKHPWYTPEDKPPVEPGKNNPLGTRWIGISKPHYGIHGTKAPWTIGSRASGGCIRMFNKDVEKLYRHIEKGTRIIIKKRHKVDLTKLSSITHKKHSEEES